MSLDFNNAPMCPKPCCTNLLTSRTEFENNICDACLFDLQEHWDKEREELKIDEDKNDE